jgi:hypothetical protein
MHSSSLAWNEWDIARLDSYALPTSSFLIILTQEKTIVNSRFMNL